MNDVSHPGHASVPPWHVILASFNWLGLVNWRVVRGSLSPLRQLRHVFATRVLRFDYIPHHHHHHLKKWQKLTIKLLKELWGSRNQIKFASTRAKGIKRETTSRQALIAWTWLWFDLTWGMLRLFLCQNFTTLFYIVTFSYFSSSVFLFLTALPSLWIFFRKCETNKKYTDQTLS